MRQKRYAVFAKPPSGNNTQNTTQHIPTFTRGALSWPPGEIVDDCSIIPCSNFQNIPKFAPKWNSLCLFNRSIVGEVAAEDVTCRRWGEPKTQMFLCEKPSEWMQNPEIEIILGQSKSWQSCLNPGCVSSWECPCTLATLGNVLRFYFDLQYSIPLAAWNLQEIWGHHAVGWEQNRMESTQSAKRINHSALPSWQCLTMSCMVSSLMNIQNRYDILDRSVIKYVITLY